MKSSFKVIKNSNVEFSNENIVIANVKLKEPIIEEVYEEVFEEEIIDESIDSNININQLKIDLRNELISEMEEERQALFDNTVNEAKKEIENLKKEAINKGYEKGYSKGHDDGFKEGVEKAFKECEVQCNEIKEKALGLIRQAEAEVSDYIVENRTNLINLAGEMAESIVHKTIDTSSENVLSLIKPIIEQYEATENIILTCHPDTMTFLEDNIEKLKEANQGIRFILLKDENLEKNGCTIENESQIIDLQIGKQINSIIEDLRNMEV